MSKRPRSEKDSRRPRQKSRELKQLSVSILDLASTVKTDPGLDLSDSTGLVDLIERYVQYLRNRTARQMEAGLSLIVLDRLKRTPESNEQSSSQKDES